jgi:cytochrome c553
MNMSEFTNTLYTPASQFASVVIYILLFIVTPVTGAPLVAKLPTTDKQLLGERIYRLGVLPSGEPLQAYIKGDISVPGTSFSCVSCHLRSGLGSFEGGVVTPPTTGTRIFNPTAMSYKQVVVENKQFPSHLQRPAYTELTLASALRGGVNSAGQVMNPVMPRYQLHDDDMNLLISYLKSLSSEFSPGISDTELHFATVITDDVPAAESEAMLASLEQYFSHKNNMVQLFKKQKRSERMAAVMLESSEIMYKKITLSRWFLTGPPDTWRSQLEEQYRKQPVFALLGGISRGEWQPVHEFCESHRIPSLFPQTMFPVISDSDWYTLYFSKGYYQEGEGAARFLNKQSELQSEKKIVQIIRDSREGRALSRGFNETWRELGHPAPVSITLNPGELISKDVLSNLLKKEQPEVLLLWDDENSIPTLELLANAGSIADTVLLSSSYLGDHVWSIPDRSRDVTWLTYPYRLPQGEDRFKGTMAAFISTMKSGVPNDSSIKQSYITTQILTQALMDLRGNYYRDNFFDVLGMMKDQDLPLYERLSFGPGQRYASKGCFIVKLEKGHERKLIPMNDWVTY